MPPEHQTTQKDNPNPDIVPEPSEEETSSSTEIPQLLAQNEELHDQLETAMHEVSQDNAEESGLENTTPEMPNTQTASLQEEVPSFAPQNSTTENTALPTHIALTPQNEEDLAAEEKLQKMRLSAFGQMVIKSKNLPQHVDKKFHQKAAGLIGSHTERIGALTGTGLALKSVYDFGTTLNSAEKKDALAPTNKKNDWTTAAMTAASSAILIALSAVRIYKTFSTSDDSTGVKIAKSLPPLFKILALGSDTVTSILESCKESNMTTKSILNFSTPFKSLMSIIENTIDFYQINKQLKKISSLSPNSQSRFQVIKKDLIEKKNSFFTRIPALGAQCIAELSYAVAYLKNPKSNTTLGTKMGVHLSSLVKNTVDVYHSRGNDEARQPDLAHKNLAQQEYEDFKKLYSDDSGLFIGTEETPASLTSVEDKNKVFQAYKDFYKELKVMGLSVKELSEASSKEEQQELITNAIGF